MMKKIFSSGLFALIILSSQAQIPATLSYQGLLTNASGVPVADGNHTVFFKFYTTASGGSPVFTRGTITVSTFKGLFTAILGNGQGSNNDPLPYTLGDTQYYIGIEADGGAELVPRITLTAVPYAFTANTVKTVDATTITTGTIPDARLSTHVQDLADGSLTGNKIGTGISATNITTGTLAGNLVGTGINANNITTGTISSANVSLTGTGASKLATGTTAERPGLPVEGQIRYNSTEKVMEYYNGIDWYFLTPKVAYLKDVKAPGTSGGTFNAGSWASRILNDLQGDNTFISLVTALATNTQFQLTPGTYEIEGSAPAANVLAHKCRLQTVTVPVVTLLSGTTQHSETGSATTGNRSYLYGTITITSNTIIELQHRCENTQTGNGFGNGGDVGIGANEIFSLLKIKKLDSVKFNPMRFLLLCLLTSLTGFTFAQTQAIHSNVSSSGTTAGVATNGTLNLWSSVGQPIATSSANFTQTQAGFTQVANYIIIVADIYPPVILFTAVTTINASGSNSLTAQISDLNDINFAQLNYRPIGGSAFQTANLTKGSGDDYTILLNPAWNDAMGIEYFFTSEDTAPTPNLGRNPETGTYLAYLNSSSVTVPLTSFGAEQINYRIIAFPFALTSNSVATLFDELGTYDNSKWRMATYNNTSDNFPEYPGDFTGLERGKGYWLIVRNPIEINVGPADAPHENRASLFEITLRPGWNMIGNPYPLEIDWANAQQLNNDSGIGPLYLYEGGWENATLLPAFQGAFVNYSGSTPKLIKIPFKGQTAEGGRKKFSDNDWKMDLHIFQGETFNKTGGFGMHKDASDEEDFFDGFNPPAFVNSPEVYFVKSNPEFTPNLDIAGHQDEYFWNLMTRGKQDELYELRWNGEFSKPLQNLYLFDKETLDLINMMEEDHYAFRSTGSQREFLIYYGSTPESIHDDLMVSVPFPNPVQSGMKLTSRVVLPNGTANQKTITEIIDSRGVVVSRTVDTLSEGVHEIIMTVNFQPGLYFMRQTIANNCMINKFMVK